MDEDQHLQIETGSTSENREQKNERRNETKAKRNASEIRIFLHQQMSSLLNGVGSDFF